MAVSASDLKAHRDALAGREPGEDNGKSRIDRIIKMFTPADEIAAIKDLPSTVRIGTPPVDIMIRPMSTRTLLESLGIIRKLIGPLLEMSNKQITTADMLEQLSENVKDLPILIYNILKRGNETTITQDWVDDNFDVLLDLQVVLPIFLRQNALDKLFGGGQASPKDEAATKAAPTDPFPQTTAE